MKRVPIHFLPVQVLGAKRSKRDSELEISKAKSHSSRVSYPRKPVKKTTRRYVVGNTYLALGKSVNNDNLDPFIQLVIDLSDQDRNLLQTCKRTPHPVMNADAQDLTTKPSNVYGTTANSPFCPVRDAAIPHFKTNAIYIHWHLLLVETTDAARYARRANIYGQLRELINNEENWKLDSTIFTIAASAICENRSGTEIGRAHLTAVVKLMQLRNGLRTIQEMSFETGITVLCALVMWEKELTVETVTIPRGRKVPDGLKQYFEDRSYQGPIFKAHLACLHCMNGILQRAEGLEFLQDLEKTLQRTMPPFTILCGIAYSAKKFGYWETDILRMWEAIEFVEVVSSMEHVGWVSEAMSSWLTTGSGVEVQEVVEEVQRHVVRGTVYSERHTGA
jgi:hypothetical protein